MNVSMNDRTVDYAALSGIIFLICIIIVFELIPTERVNTKTVNQVHLTKNEDNNGEGHHISMEMNRDDNMEIPLPDSIDYDDIDVTYDIIEKRVNIYFELNKDNIDVTKVINTTDKTEGISYKSENGKLNIEIILNDYYQTKWDVNNGWLYVRFFPIDRSKPVVVIDPGHGGFDVGANVNNIYEKDINLSVCRKIEEMNAGSDIQIISTRGEDYYHSVEERAAFANTFSPDLFVSVHINWYQDAGINGTSVLYNSVNGEAFGTSYWLAGILQKNVVKSLGTFDMGLEDGKSIYVVRYVNVPSALVELGFITNQSDLQILTSEDGKRKSAAGVYEGIRQALKEMGKIQN